LKPFKVNQPMDVVVCRMRPETLLSMLHHPKPQIVRHADVQVPRSTAQDVNEKGVLLRRHARSLNESLAFAFAFTLAVALHPFFRRVSS
jgi:hypothetical protein